VTSPREVLNAYGDVMVPVPVDDVCPIAEVPRASVASKTFAALRAVLDLHAPVTRDGHTSVCGECTDAARGLGVRDGAFALFPCPTVQVVLMALEKK
jgi:hypothetical protein